LGSDGTRWRVVACVVPDTKGATLIPNVIERVMPRSTVYSDEAYAYDPKGIGLSAQARPSCGQDLRRRQRAREFA